MISDSDDSTLGDDAEDLHPSSVQLLSGNQFRSMIEREVTRVQQQQEQQQKMSASKRKKGTSRAPAPQLCQQCRQSTAVPTAAGNALDAVRSRGTTKVPLPEHLKKEGSAEEYYVKMIQAREDLKIAQNDLKLTKKKLLETEHDVKRKQKKDGNLMKTLKDTMAGTGGSKVKTLVAENEQLENRILLLTDSLKAKNKEIKKLSSGSGSSDAQRGKMKLLESKIASSNETIISLKSQLQDALVSTAGGSPLSKKAIKRIEADTIGGTTSDQKRKIKNLKQQREDLHKTLKDEKLASSNQLIKYMYQKLLLQATMKHRRIAESEIEEYKQAQAREKEKNEMNQVAASDKVSQLEESLKSANERCISLQGLLRQAQNAAGGVGSAQWSELIDKNKQEVETHQRKFADLQRILRETERTLEETKRKHKADEANMQSKMKALYTPDIVARDAEIKRLKKELENSSTMQKDMERQKESAIKDANRKLTNWDETNKSKSSSLQEDLAKKQSQIEALTSKNKEIQRKLDLQNSKMEALREQQEKQRREGYSPTQAKEYGGIRKGEVVDDDDDDDDDY
eukprot:TRINITY_DN7837_c0_g1_i1.p1 TRINITY_DN7837_c0_g1~~TRINITY_DN7837_c0_g1_i1.p1  ORF type:complete len:569 (+),score=171.75 TRINITY_DN7837_c0_g1_i1:115-1821(+)